MKWLTSHFILKSYLCLLSTHHVSWNFRMHCSIHKYRKEFLLKNNHLPPITVKEAKRIITFPNFLKSHSHVQSIKWVLQSTTPYSSMSYKISSIYRKVIIIYISQFPLRAGDQYSGPHTSWTNALLLGYSPSPTWTLFFFFFFGGSTGNWTQGLSMCSTSELYHQPHMSNF